MNNSQCREGQWGMWRWLRTIDQTFRKGNAETRPFGFPDRGQQVALPALACGLVLDSPCFSHSRPRTTHSTSCPACKLLRVCLSPCGCTKPLRVLSSWSLPHLLQHKGLCDGKWNSRPRQGMLGQLPSAPTKDVSGLPP